MNHDEMIFEASEAPEGGYDAPALGHGIFTQGEDRDHLKDMVRDAVRCHFTGDDVPGVIRLHYVRDEAVAAWDSPATSPDGTWPVGSHTTTVTP